MADAETKSLSPMQLRLRRFRRMKRGYYSFLILTVTYIGSFFLPFLMNNRAIMVKYEGEYYFPAFKTYWHDTFNIGTEEIYLHDVFGQQVGEDGTTVHGETDYRALQKQFEEADEGNQVTMPLIAIHHSADQFYQPPEWAERDAEGKVIGRNGYPPFAPSQQHGLGRDDRGRDLGVRLVYGYRVSLSFAFIVAGVAYSIGITVGALLGYLGGYFDFFGQRFVEIWGAIPFLYTVIIVSAVIPGDWKWIGLVGILSMFGWMLISYYMRGEFYREKSKDYVAAAIATGESHFQIIFKHVLPNTLTPIITFLPFAIVGHISTLVALDFLGFGLQPPAPSWGELLNQAKQYQGEWHLVVFPLLAMFITLQLIVFVGEAVREAFDPKVFSRLR